MYGQYIGRGEQFVHCREVVHSSECPLSEVPLYIAGQLSRRGSKHMISPLFLLMSLWLVCYTHEHKSNYNIIVCCGTASTTLGE